MNRARVSFLEPPWKNTVYSLLYIAMIMHIIRVLYFDRDKALLVFFMVTYLGLRLLI